MQLIEFFDMIESLPEITGNSIDEETGQISVIHNQSGICTVLSADAITQTDRDTLHDIIMTKREPHVLKHLSRVCGYYSYIGNWNKSKQGERRDRLKGDYILDERIDDHETSR